MFPRPSNTVAFLITAFSELSGTYVEPYVPCVSLLNFVTEPSASSCINGNESFEHPNKTRSKRLKNNFLIIFNTPLNV